VGGMKILPTFLKTLRNMRKFLLLGSAAYIKDWYSQNGSKYLSEGFILCAINNAWNIDQDNLKIWFHPNDFFKLDITHKPPEGLKDKWIEVVKFIDRPFFYDMGSTSGTMLLNVLCHLLNQEFYNNSKSLIAIAGSDLIYRNDGKDHFYGIGTPDPMRLGKYLLEKQLQVIKEVSEKIECGIVNAGGQAKTLLPFKRYSL
jgi:hypothetical protein